MRRVWGRVSQGGQWEECRSDPPPRPRLSPTMRCEPLCRCSTCRRNAAVLWCGDTVSGIWVRITGSGAEVARPWASRGCPLLLPELRFDFFAELREAPDAGRSAGGLLGHGLFTFCSTFGHHTLVFRSQPRMRGSKCRGGRADALVMMCGVISSGVMMRSEKVIDIELEILEECKRESPERVRSGRSTMIFPGFTKLDSSPKVLRCQLDIVWLRHTGDLSFVWPFRVGERSTLPAI